jgi:hypothetical protein
MRPPSIPPRDSEAHDDLERGHFPLTWTLVTLVAGSSIASAIATLLS